MQIVLITGLSGSGKSVALKVLEDYNYYCIDNLPITFLMGVVSFLMDQNRLHVGISIDTRSGVTSDELLSVLDAFEQRGVDVRTIFLEAKDDILIKRFSETRRRHPLAAFGHTVLECIDLEREQLSCVPDRACRVDTSDLSVNKLRYWVSQYLELQASDVLTLTFESFGYKWGMPVDLDFMFDVRCLPNPYYDYRLRELTGLDQPIQSFLQKEPTVLTMTESIYAFLSQWIAAFAGDGRVNMTTGIGCTGGQHRSVYLTECIANLFRPTFPVIVRHRHLPLA